MSRAERLLDLLQSLRRHRAPVTGAALAAELGVSLRTLYRDIATLQGQGANIEGEAGLGYVLRPGFDLPPLNFTPDEIDAIALGIRWVSQNADETLTEAALNALVKISAVLPAARRGEPMNSSLMVGPGLGSEDGHADPGEIREALREERKLRIAYSDKYGEGTERVIWPVAMAYFQDTRVLVAWCELRGDFRHFRLDRIGRLDVLKARFPERRLALLRRWRAAEGLDEI